MGLGWYVTDYRGERLVWHYGHWGTGFSALYLKVPARHLTLIAFANSEALADHHYKVGEDVTNDLFACDFINTFVPAVALRGSGSGHKCLAFDSRRDPGLVAQDVHRRPSRRLRNQLPHRASELESRPHRQGAQAHRLSDRT
jgi:hypothetical protein